MTYNQLFNRVYGAKPVDAEFWATVDEPTKKAWGVIDANKAHNFYFDLKRYRAKLLENDTPFTA